MNKNCKNCNYYNNGYCKVGRRPIDGVCNGYSGLYKDKKYIPGKYKNDLNRPHEHRCIVCGSIFIVPNIETWAWSHTLNNPLFTKRNDRSKLLCSYTCMLRYRDVIDPEANINIRTFDATKYNSYGNLNKEEKNEN